MSGVLLRGASVAGVDADVDEKMKKKTMLLVLGVIDKLLYVDKLQLLGVDKLLCVDR